MGKATLKIMIFTLIISFIFTACKNNNEKSTVEEFLVPGLYNDSGETSLDYQEVTLYFLHYGDWTIPENILNALNVKCKKEINTKLNFKYNKEYDFDKKISYTDRIRELISAGETFDAFYLKGGSSAKYFLNNEESGELLLDISSIFPDYAPVLYQKYNDDVLSEAWYKDINGNKKMVYVPAVAPNTNRPYILINSENLKNYGFDKINTLEVLEEYLDTVKEDKGKVIVNLSYNDLTGLFSAYTYFCFLYGYEKFYYKIGSATRENIFFVRKLDEPNSKLTAFDQTEEFYEYINFINRFKEKGYFNSEYSLNKAYDAYMGYKKEIDRILNQNFSIKYDIFKMYPENKVEKAGLYSNNDKRDVIAFNKHAKNPERAMIFLEWLQLKQENYDLLMYGEEGIDYILDENGQMKKINNSFMQLWMSSGGRAFLNPEYIRTTFFQLENFYEDIYNKISENIYELSFENFKIDNTKWNSDNNQIEKDRYNSISKFFDKLSKDELIQNIEIITFISKQAGSAEKLRKIYQTFLNEWEE